MAARNKGDAIFIYSDGVTEAMNSRHELFSEARLEDELDRLKGLPVEDIIAGVMEKIRRFAQDEPQADDITESFAQLPLFVISTEGRNLNRFESLRFLVSESSSK